MKTTVREVIVAAALLLSACSSNDGAPGDGGASPTETGGQAGPQFHLEGRNLTDQERVTASGSGFPGGVIELVECRQDPRSVPQETLADVCDLTRPARSRTRTSDDGTIEAVVVVRTTIGVGQRREVSCLEEHCVFAATDGERRVYAVATVPWAEDPHPVPSPHLRIVSITYGPSVGRALVTGSRYPPNTKVALVQCPASPVASTEVDADDCLYDQTFRVTSDSDGRFRAHVTVAPRFQRSTGELIDCRATPAGCALADPWPSRIDVRMSLATFDQAIH